jgi:hypothetical protein
MKHHHCKKYRAMFSDALYRELPETGQAALQAHLEDCPLCAAEYAGMAAVLEKMDERKRPDKSEEYWENYWDRLEEKIAKEPLTLKDRLRLNRLWQWTGSFDFRMGRVLYPVSAVLLILLGIFIGKYIYAPAPVREVVTANRRAASTGRIYAAAAQHFDNLKPLLVECSNYTGDDKTAETIPVETEALKKLLFRHHLLKKAAAETGNDFLKQLLDELEIILLEICNSNGQKTPAMKTARDILKSNDILFKMNVYSHQGKRAEKI